MSSPAHHHTEWLSLLEISGPFLSMPVLLRVFPQGLEAADPDLHHLLRSAYEEWANNQHGLQPDESIHTQWLRFVLASVLGMELIYDHHHTGLLTGASLPTSLRINAKEHNELLFPDYALHAPNEPQPRLLIQQYPTAQDLNTSLPNRHWKDSPAQRMAYLLRATNVRLGLITNGEHWMLIDAPRNETTAFISWYAYLWIEEPLTLRALHSLLHQRRFFSVAPNDTLEALLSESTSNQHEVTNQLGYQVRRAVEVLLHTLDRVDRESKRALLAEVSETDLYNAALTVMMRLVFLLSAEERKLLPYGEALYNQYYAASTLQSKLREQADHQGEEVLEQRYDAWSRLLALFRAVYGGVEHPNLNLLAYDGRLFDPDRFPFLEGRPSGTSWLRDQAQPLAIDNRTVLHLLEALQLLQVEVPGGGIETRRLSFRALDVEQIGHVYEGLLDHTARRADQPILSLQRSGKLQEGVEVALTQLEAHRAKSEQDLLTYLEKLTGHSPNTIHKKLAYTPNMHRRGILHSACNDDEALLQHVLPFAGLLRDDNFGRPLIFTAQTLYMTTGTDRRTSGTHYTPPSLTEPLVQHTLDPLVYRGLAEGLPIEQCQLLTVREILNLKVCDFAVGSGAFLVQTCRYLASRLVEAWEELEWRAPDQRFTIEGLPATKAQDETPLPTDNEERLIIARRLVAERCLYGVDKNPMATEMAKLSLWLITLHKDRPFTFLDHALCAGDSLLGVNIKQLKVWSMDPNISEAEIRQHVWVQEPIRRALDTVLTLRRRLRNLVGNSIQRVEEKTRLLKQANEAMELIRLGADLLVAITLHDLSKHKHNKELKLWSDDNNNHAETHQENSHNGHKNGQTNTALTDPSNTQESKHDTNELPKMEDYTILLNDFETARSESPNAETHQHNQLAFANMRQRIDAILGERHPFHWPLMFPEVFVEEQTSPGFTALVSNPPFQGGQRITGALGTDYRDYLVNYLASGKRGSADLCAYFFLRASDIVKHEGQAGLVATNTIAQGDTREVGLEQIVAKGWTIPRAVPSRRWPGTAVLEIAYVWLRYGNWQSEYNLDDQPTSGISSALTLARAIQDKPYKLVANENKSFQGSIVLGMGFILDQQEAQQLIEKDPRNKDVIFPYLNGEDLNSRPDQSPSRWVINFQDWPLEEAETYPYCINIVREKVKPERDLNSRKVRRERWWQFAERATGLYNVIVEMERVLVCPIFTKYLSFCFEPTNIVFMNKLYIFIFNGNTHFAILSSALHEIWAREFSSTLKTDMQYTPSDCFETFPFPANIDKLEDIGERYYNHRQSIMLTRQEGLTKTYNRFHNPQENSADITQLRQLHKEMDQAVAAAYGWHDLPLAHSFHQTKQGLRYTISEAARREVLDRLLKLNHQRYAEEVAQGLHDKGAKAKRSKKQLPVPTKVTPLPARSRKQSDQPELDKVRRVAEPSEEYKVEANSETDAKDAGRVDNAEELQQGRLFDDLS